MRYIIETFDSVASFVNTINSRDRVQGSSRSSTQNDFDFTGTMSYDEANSLALYGDKKSAEKINASFRKLKLDSNHEQRAQAKVKRSPVGSRPCVAAALQGHPNSMYRRTKVMVKKPICTIYYNMSASACEEQEDIADAGAKLAEVIQTIERSGVRVNLYVGNISRTDSEQTFVFAKVKDSMKDFNLLRMSYALINPSYFRRHWFHWVETCKQITASKWSCGYGRPLFESDEYKDAEQIMRNKGVKFDAFVYYYQIRSKSVDEIIELITGGKK